jgi:predicted short-subunit dehydrogenase-like oxidoreductase (DUF2520 family)
MRRSISIVGFGNWGSSLASALVHARVPVDEVVVTGRRARRKTTGWMRSLPLTDLNHARLQADVLWLCVPDRAIASVTARLVERAADRGLTGQIVVHSSGALNARVLHAAAEAGASIGSVHPLMSFPTLTPVGLEGVPFAVEAEPAGRRILNAIVRRMGGRPFPIKPAGKALYHALGVLSSPLLVSHLAAAREVAALAGFTPRQAQRLVEPIIRATLDSFFRNGARKSFSGPIARGDAETIRLHLQALKPHPMLASIYRSLALYGVEALPCRGRKGLRASLRQN